MDFEVYCDESGLEALSNKKAHSYIAIGSLWLPAESREDLKTSIAAIKQKHNVKGELKWNKISPAYFDLYYEIINYFFETPYLRYRVIVIESEKADTLTFHNGM